MKHEEYSKEGIIKSELLKINLDKINEHRDKKNDWMHVQEGGVGTGKSTMGIRLCCYMDPTFNEDRICFSSEEFLLALDKAKPFQAVMLDEGLEALFSRDANTKATKELIKKLTAIRYKCLFIVICIANISMLESLMKGWRIDTMIRTIFLGKEMRRGTFKFYSSYRISQISKDPISKKTLYPKPNFYGQTEDIHEGDKLWDLYKRYEAKKDGFASSNRNVKVYNRMQKNLAEMKKSFTISDISKMEKINRLTIHRWIKQEKLFPKKALFFDIYGMLRVRERYYDKYMRQFKAKKEKEYMRKSAIKNL